MNGACSVDKLLNKMVLKRFGSAANDDNEGLSKVHKVLLERFDPEYMELWQVFNKNDLVKQK